MKVRLTIDLELPPGSELYSDAEMRQMLFDDYINFVTVKHYEAAMKAMVTRSELEREGCADHRLATWTLISERHQILGRVTAQPQWNVERLDG